LDDIISEGAVYWPEVTRRLEDMKKIVQLMGSEEVEGTYIRKVWRICNGIDGNRFSEPKCFEDFIEVLLDNGKNDTVRWIIKTAGKDFGSREHYWGILRRHDGELGAREILTEYATSNRIICMDVLEYSKNPEWCLENSIKGLIEYGNALRVDWFVRYAVVRGKEGIVELEKYKNVDSKIGIYVGCVEERRIEVDLKDFIESLVLDVEMFL